MKKTPIFLLLLLTLTSCDKKNVALSSKNWFFGTMVDITLYGASKENIDYLNKLFEDYDALTDGFYSKSIDGRKINNVHTINKLASGSSLEIDPRLAEVLSFGFKMQKETEYKKEDKTFSYFNPLIGNLSTMWKDFINERKPTPPSAEEISLSLQEMSLSSLSVEGTKVTKTGQATIDVGAFAKGFALKKAQEYLEGQGIKHYSINGGKSSLVFGSTTKEEAYTIVLERNDDLYVEYPAKDVAVGTSGISEQKRDYEGKTYCHIVSPIDGNALARHDTVSIKCKDPAIADVLSTVLMIGGQEAALNLTKKYDFGYLIYDGKGKEVLYNEQLGARFRK